jgi:hypothetical protein
MQKPPEDALPFGGGGLFRVVEEEPDYVPVVFRLRRCGGAAAGRDGEDGQDAE